MADEGPKPGLAAAVALCLDDQAAIIEAASVEGETDLFGQTDTERRRGRPAGSLNKATAAQAEVIRRSGQSPIAFLASVWRDHNKPLERRIQAAVAALPYVHRKQPVDVNVGGAAFTLILGDGDGGGEAAGSDLGTLTIEGTVEIDDQEKAVKSNG